MSTMLRITQVGSPIGRTQDQRATVRSLGLRRIRHTVLQPDRPEIRGMIRKVAHLVTFEEISAAEAEAFLAEREASRAPRPVPSGPRAKHLARAAVKAKRTAPTTTKRSAATVAAVTEGADDVSDSASAPVAKKAPAKKTTAKKAPAKKAAAKKPVKKAAAKKAPAKKAAAKKAPAKKSTKKSEG
jgi:ribosomal protein L30